MRTVRVPYEGRYRTYELFERYPEAVAKALPDNDTSFLVTGNASPGEVDSYPFTSRVGQYLTAVLVPENSFSDFDLELVDGKGRALAASRSDGRQGALGFLLVNLGGYIDFLQRPVAAGAQLALRVSPEAVCQFQPILLLGRRVCRL